MTNVSGAWGSIGATPVNARFRGSAFTSSYPWTTYGWLKRSGQTQNGDGFVIRYLALRYNTVEKLGIEYITTEATDRIDYDSTTDLTWHFASYVGHTSTDRDKYFDGSNTYNNTTSRTCPAIGTDSGIYSVQLTVNNSVASEINFASCGFATTDYSLEQLNETRWWPEWTDGNKVFQINSFTYYTNFNGADDLYGSDQVPTANASPGVVPQADGPPHHMMQGGI